MKLNELISMLNRALALLSALSLCCVAVPAVAQDDGVELGASISIAQANPLIAKVTIKPTINFASVFIEVPNSIKGTGNACLLHSLVAGKTYSCSVGAQADLNTNGLVVAINGHIDLAPDSPMIRKVFTVPNPTFDPVKTRQMQEVERKQKVRPELRPRQSTK